MPRTSMPLTAGRAAIVALAAAALIAGAASGARAEEAFYKNKRLTVLINFAPSGPTDIEGRLFAKHIAKHLDGNPSVIVQNKDGAGGLVGSAFLGELGPKDGTMVGYFSSTAFKFVIEPESHRFDLRRFEFIGYQPGNSVYYMRRDLEPGMQQGTDIMKAKGLVAAGLAADSAKDLLMRLTLDMLGLEYRYVTGYRSNNDARLALQRSEVTIFMESTPAFFSVIEPNLVKTGVAMPVWYNPTVTAGKLLPMKAMESTGIPMFQDFYKKVKGAEPSGQLWETYKTNLSVDSAILRMIVMPPDVPKASTDAMRAAVAKLNEDKEYADEAMKMMQFVPFYETGPDVGDRVRKTLTVSPDFRNFVLEYIKSAKK
jgi:tripartite-type tricarboxylate transporter receptor subunit TctC